MIILGHHYVTILLAKMLFWAPFSQSMCTVSVLTPASFFLVTSTNVGISLQNLLTFSFNPFVTLL